MLQISQSISPEEAVQPMEIQQVIQVYQQLIYGIALTGNWRKSGRCRGCLSRNISCLFSGKQDVSRRRTSESMVDSDSL